MISFSNQTISINFTLLLCCAISRFLACQKLAIVLKSQLVAAILAVFLGYFFGPTGATLTRKPHTASIDRLAKATINFTNLFKRICCSVIYRSSTNHFSFLICNFLFYGSWSNSNKLKSNLKSERFI